MHTGNGKKKKAIRQNEKIQSGGVQNLWVEGTIMAGATGGTVIPNLIRGGF